MDGDQNPTIAKWEKRRKSTFIAICFQMMLQGFGFFTFSNTVWSYVSETLRPSDPYFTYSLMAWGFYLSPLILSSFTSYLHDIYRRTRLFMVILNFICMVGAIFYLLYMFPYAPTFGCVLLGFKYLFQPVAFGEVSRSYEPEELTRKLPIITIAYYAGIVPAGIVTYASQGINWNMKLVHINYGNFYGVVSLIAHLIMQVITLIFAHDISREFTLKSFILAKNNDETNQSEEEDMENLLGELSGVDFIGDHEVCQNELGQSKNLANNENLTMLNSLKRIFKNFDLLLIYFLTMLFNYNVAIYLAAMPLFIQDKLHYSVLVLNVYNISFCTCLLVFLLIMVTVKISSATAYYVGIISMLLLIVIGVYLKILDVRHGKLYNIAILTITSISVAISYSAEDIFLTVSIAKLVKPDIQSFADGIRTVIQLGGVAFGSLSSPLYVKYTNTFIVVLGLIILISVSIMLQRRKTLKNPIAVV